LLTGLALLASACAESKDQEEKCSVTADCSKVNYVCTIENVCKPINSDRPCFSDGDCLGNERCSDQSLCYVPQVDPDADVSDVSDQEELPEEVTDIQPDEVKDKIEEEALDTTPPTVVDRSPEVDAVDVALDAAITVTFSEAMFPSTVQDPANFVVKDSSNRVIGGEIAWDDATLTATFTPTAPWWALSSYTVTLSSGIMDASRNSLIEIRWTFTTTTPPDAAFYDQLARAYAPVIYQDVSDTKLDVPLKIDYDGDLRPFNNAANINSGQKIATIYYSVAETETHFFIHYILYYPVYKASSTAEPQNHTVNGILVVVLKGVDPLGTLELFETYSSGFDPGRIRTFLPDCTPESLEPYCPLAYTKKNTVPPSPYHDIAADKYTDPENPRRVRVYSKQRTHELCHFAYNQTSAGYCQHDAEQFTFETNAVLTLASGSATPAPPDFSSTHTGEYQLIPIAPLWWTMRTSKDGSTTAFYLEDFPYTGAGATQPGGDNSTRMPNRLSSESESGNNGLYSPWAWKAEDDFALAKGVWFVDPAFAIQARLNAPETFSFSAAKYCFNLYTGIDRTQSVADCMHVNP
jgi:hypothetical protein